LPSGTNKLGVSFKKPTFKISKGNPGRSAGLIFGSHRPTLFIGMISLIKISSS